jgi:hypothetical protein
MARDDQSKLPVFGHLACLLRFAFAVSLFIGIDCLSFFTLLQLRSIHSGESVSRMPLFHSTPSPPCAHTHTPTHPHTHTHSLSLSSSLVYFKSPTLVIELRSRWKKMIYQRSADSIALFLFLSFSEPFNAFFAYCAAIALPSFFSPLSSPQKLGCLYERGMKKKLYASNSQEFQIPRHANKARGTRNVDVGTVLILKKTLSVHEESDEDRPRDR